MHGEGGVVATDPGVLTSAGVKVDFSPVKLKENSNLIRLFEDFMMINL